MIISDTAVKRPVFALVLSLLLVVFGLISFDRLALREYPDIDPPIVSIDTNYPGASADIVETRITRLIEDRIAGIEGIKTVNSSSTDGRSRISIEFNINRDVDGAANDIRDRVSGVLNNLPVEADPPEIEKVDSSDDVVIWLNLTSDRMTVPELTDYANRYLVDRFSVLDGVARVRVGGAKDFAMRIWLDRGAMTAHNVTSADIEQALRAENRELPAGYLESTDRQFTLRLQRQFQSAADFARLAIATGDSGHVVRLGDVARVELGSAEDRSTFRGNGEPMVGIGITRQSTGNIVAVAEAAKAEMVKVNKTLPDGMHLSQSYDASVFVSEAIKEVYTTLVIAVILVTLVIYLFLGNWRATLVPAVTVPVSLIATSILLYAFGFSINLLTLLALVLAIGLVVDDAIVVLENIFRRMDEYGEPPLLAAYRGAREVGFAVVATTMVLVAVFVPITFLEGDIGRLFSEFALTMSAAVIFSSITALTLSPMLAAKLIRPNDQHNAATRFMDKTLTRVQHSYSGGLDVLLRKHWIAGIAFVAVMLFAALSFRMIPTEYAPREDRGSFFLLVNGPEGASYQYMQEYMDTIEERLMPLVEKGYVNRLLVRSPRSFGTSATFNTGMVIFTLAPWGERPSAFELMNQVRATVSDLSGVRAFPVMRQSFGGGLGKPVQFVLGGSSYEQLTQWRDQLNNAIDASNPGLLGVDWDYKETQPQLRINVDYERAADLGVQVSDVGTTLQTMFGSLRATTFINNGEEYDVILEGERELQRTPDSLENLYVRSSTTGELIPLQSLVEVSEYADSPQLQRYNRVRSITLDANLADGLVLGEALEYLNNLVDENLEGTPVIDYKGQSKSFQDSSNTILFAILLGALVVFLVLAAQFESFIHPLVIMFTVPLAMAGALLGLLLTNQSLNIYSQVGLIMLVGLAAKNGILIVEFANQLRDRGVEFGQALRQAAETRLRPILMTGITTAAGSLPLLLSSGAGSETRAVIGTVVLFGVLAATLFTVYIVPVAYDLLARRTGSPGQVARDVAALDAQHPVKNSD
ncbi:efflux RND transporter permease subunit [Microbulbifer hydrolyticus]|uniref:MMPL family transporter n=1 Tax=Microbulbifer hydrolyticus TaxID=48074 RepID=A0A6P1T784_9GAMM|nr:efflux RND transporter permease subunit [Microbulbifer hydrolyticus]MBB5211357.1 multidrug efflux pump [Microbulbifer hydrolyticus]QHQ37887.1 MMPL family transporter [Microbulbifer hydrolyticus]